MDYDDPIIPETIRRYMKLHPKCKDIIIYSDESLLKEKEVQGTFNKRKIRIEYTEKLKTKLPLIDQYICTYDKNYENINNDPYHIRHKIFYVFSTTDSEYTLAILIVKFLKNLEWPCLYFTTDAQFKTNYKDLDKVYNTKL